MKTYIISLGHPTELIDKLDQEQMNPVVVHGIHGASASEETIRTGISSFYSAIGPKSSIGCSLSHMKAWKQFLATDDPHALFVEDDVILEEGWKDKLHESIPHAPSTFDLLYLGCMGCDATISPLFWTLVTSLMGIRVPEKKINDHITVPSSAFATHAYLLSRKGAAALLSELEGNVHNHIDFCIQSLAKKGKLERYMITPRIAYQTSTDTNVSENVSSSHPRMFSKLVQSHYVDRSMRASYITSVSIARIHPKINVNGISVLFLVLGFLLSNYSVSALTLAFILLSSHDLMYLKKSTDGMIIVLHYLLFILPSLVKKIYLGTT